MVSVGVADRTTRRCEAGILSRKDFTVSIGGSPAASYAVGKVYIQLQSSDTPVAAVPADALPHGLEA
jgi:hypothetical protein